MLATSVCREVRFAVLPASLSSNVPRCLFGTPNPKETVEMLQEALEMERSRFARRWGVDPRNEKDDKDKENRESSNAGKATTKEKPPRKKASPYPRQSNICDFWPARKTYDIGRKTIKLAGDAKQQQQQQQSIEKPTPSS